MTRADRLYRVWLERELGKITTEEAFERVDRVMREPEVFPEYVPPQKILVCRGCGGEYDAFRRGCRTCASRHSHRRRYVPVAMAA